MNRRYSRSVKVGNITVGGSSPIAVQTMWDRPIKEVDDDLINRINALKPIGCDVIRFGVPLIEDADRLGEIAKRLHMPVVADIHFDYRIAMRCLDYPIAKLRLNPGNIENKDHIAQVAAKAKDKGVPIRIGVNGGSLPAKLRQHPNPAEALVLCALEEVSLLEAHGFDQIIISVKDSNPYHVDEAVRSLAAQCDYPLHLGITEAGPLIPAITQSAFFLGTLLKDGIGDTIRISISDRVEYEIMAARQLLSVLKLDQRPMPKLISCPLCARNTFDTHAFTKKLEPLLYSMNKEFTVAVMGCTVNGPGEAAKADLAISGVGRRVLVYRKGEKIFDAESAEAEAFFMAELERLSKE